VVRGTVVRGGEMWVAIQGVGWVPVVDRVGNEVLLGDGSRVPLVEVVLGTSPQRDPPVDHSRDLLTPRL